MINKINFNKTNKYLNKYINKNKLLPFYFLFYLVSSSNSKGCNKTLFEDFPNSDSLNL